MRFFLIMSLTTAGIIASASTRTPAVPDEYRSERVLVSYAGIGEAYAKAIAQTAEKAMLSCETVYGFDMPRVVAIEVVVDPKAKVRLFNDGADRFSLTIRREQDLRKPRESGTFHIYGLCHEVAHLAMYRPIQDRRWLSTAGAEGWAHYLGSQLVDLVYASEGERLWPDRYDYRDDGTKRLQEQSAAASRSPTVDGALHWKEFAQIVQPKGIAPAFQAWGQADIDASDPAVALVRAMKDASPDPRLATWWERAEAVIVSRQEKSAQSARTAKRSELTGKPKELAQDDGQSAGKKSTAGGGHAVRFSVSDATWYLTAVRIYGSRYGTPQPPKEQFRVWLCDDEFKTIAEFQFPYASFKYGNPDWVELQVDPTNLPQKFIVCVGFNPTATKGVYVHHDAEAGSSALSGLPGKAARPFAGGDWLLRVLVDQPKSADALSDQK